MALRRKVLKIKAEKFERKKLQLLEVTKERVAALEPLLQDIYSSRRPKPNDYETRRELVRVFNDIAKDIFGHTKDIPVVVEFGSFVMDLFTTTSDLDLSVNFRKVTVPFPREKKIQTLRKFARKLYAIQSKGHVCGVLPIPQAKVPILKCVDIGTRVECDISVENRDGILKSHIIQIISSIDERFKKLSFLMKNWAKAHNINSSKDKTLNSLSIILLVAFHLQTRNPPILPPFADIFKDGTDPATVEKSLSSFVNYGQRNKESLAELFVTLLIKLSSVEKLWPKGLCASACTASWTSKTWDSKVACISVEDFTDQTQNVARAVGQAEMKLIYKCIDISLKHIFSFINGKIGGNVKDLLFGQDGLPTSIPRRIRNLHRRPALPGVASKAHQTRGKVTGKRKKRDMRGKTVIIQVGEQQHKVLESCSAKRTRTVEGWRAMPDGSWAPPPSEDPIVGQHVDSTRDWNKTEQAAATEGWAITTQPKAAGWGETGQPSSSSWGGTEKLSGGDRGWTGTAKPRDGDWGETGKPSSSSWGGTEKLSGGGRGWSGTAKPRDGGWGETGKPSSSSWRGTEKLSGGGRGWAGSAKPRYGGWGETGKPNSSSWGGTEKLSGGGTGWAGTTKPRDGGWGETGQPSSSSWGGTEKLSGGDRGWTGTAKPRDGDWGETGKPSSSSWGGTEKLSGGGRGWSGTAKPRDGGWGETGKPSSSSWRGTEKLSGGGRGWAGSAKPRYGGWGETGKPNSSSWGGTEKLSGGGTGWAGTTKPRDGGWGETGKPSSSSWGGTEKLSGGGRGWAGTGQPRAGGWGEIGKPSSSSWGGTEKLSGGGRGWAGTKQPCGGDWGETGQPRSSSWGGTVQPCGGGWGVTQQSSAIGWGD